MGRNMSLHTILSQDELKELLREVYDSMPPKDRCNIDRMLARRAKDGVFQQFGLYSFLQFILVGLNSREVDLMIESVFEKETGKGEK